MVREIGTRRLVLLVLAVLAVVAAVALPVLAASPSPSASGGPGEKPGKGPKASHKPEVAVTLRGLVGTATAVDGEAGYTLTVDGKVLHLEADPSWLWGDKDPLKAVVGKTVTVAGEQSGDEVDVTSIDGTAIRDAGRPPWAGGPKAVGSAHPGWSQDKADKWAAKADAHGGTCWPPGQCKDHGPDGADESEAPGS